MSRPRKCFIFSKDVLLCPIFYCLLAFGIDFGDDESVVCAPMTSFFDPDSIPKEFQTTISCAYNRDRFRTTPTKIFLANKERVIGQQANSRNSIVSWKHKIGIYKLHHQTSRTASANTINVDQAYFNTNYDGTGSCFFSIEQVTAMFFRKLIQGAHYPADIPAGFSHPPPFDSFISYLLLTFHLLFSSSSANVKNSSLRKRFLLF